MLGHEIRIIADKISTAARMLPDLPPADRIVVYVHPQSGWAFLPNVEVRECRDPIHDAMTDAADETVVWLTCAGFTADSSIFDVKAQRGIVAVPALFIEDGTTKVFNPPPFGMMLSFGMPAAALLEGVTIEKSAHIRCSIPVAKLTFSGRRGIEVEDTESRPVAIRHDGPKRHRPTGKWKQPAEQQQHTASQEDRPGPVRPMAQWKGSTPESERIETTWGNKVEISLVHALDSPPSDGFSAVTAVPCSQAECEALARSLRCHWICLLWRNDIHHDLEMIARSAMARSDREMLVFPGMTLVNPSRIRMLPPLQPDLKTWAEGAARKAYLTAFDADGTPLRTENSPPIQTRGQIKVCVTSMCGVTSAEDRYGLGGEHQVVHWLRDGFLRDPRVELCDVYDTINSCMAPNDYYDLILSNSCWARPPKPAPNGLSIFWHFNTNCYQGDPPLVQRMGYNVAWTNSPSSLEQFRQLGMRARLKHLNASTEFHELYPWQSEMFVHDVIYLGGYQVEYKGVELIHRYIKACIGQGFDFAIYGNRKWKYDVQLEALRTDHTFKPEHLDDAYEPVWKGVLHPQDFRILARNAKIWVNFNSEDQRPLGMCNDRPIWAMHAGAFLITDDTREQRELYGDTCDYSRGGDHLLSRIRYWLDHEEERLERAEAARQNIISLGLHTDETARLALEELGR